MQQGLSLEHEKFDAIWNRVTQSMQEQLTPEKEIACGCDRLEETDEQLLRERICDSHSLIHHYGGLLRICGKNERMRRIFIRLAMEERADLARLQLEYYLMTGDSALCIEDKSVTGGVLSLLREAYLRERQMEQLYIAGIGMTGSVELSAMYQRLANRKHEHRTVLRRLISEIIT